MIKGLISLLWRFAGLIIAYNAIGQNYSIKVTVTGLRNNSGKVILYLYNSENGYPQDHNRAFRTANNSITGNTCVIILTDIPKGIYAVACFHDENNNGKLDTNLLGIPAEGVGASNNAKGFMGPPKFKDAKFYLKKDMVIAITVNH